MTNQLSSNLHICSLCIFIPTGYPSGLCHLCASVFWRLHNIFKSCTTFYETGFTFLFQFASSSRGPPEIQLTWGAIGLTQQDTWAEQKRGRCRLAFSSFSLKTDSHWPALGFENMFLYVPGPPHYHSTILIIMTLNENLHTGPIYKHTKELRCSSASQYEFCYWVAWDEAYCWCFIILRKEFLKATLVTSQ